MHARGPLDSGRVGRKAGEKGARLGSCQAGPPVLRINGSGRGSRFCLLSGALLFGCRGRRAHHWVRSGPVDTFRNPCPCSTCTWPACPVDSHGDDGSSPGRLRHSPNHRSNQAYVHGATKTSSLIAWVPPLSAIARVCSGLSVRWLPTTFHVNSILPRVLWIVVDRACIRSCIVSI
jgi:hypothetical protein